MNSTVTTCVINVKRDALAPPKMAAAMVNAGSPRSTVPTGIRGADGAGLVAADTLDGTLSLLERWLALSPEQRQQMGERAKACFAARFAMRRATENLLAVIRVHVEGGNGGAPISKPLSQTGDRA